MNLYYVHGVTKTTWNYIILASSKEKAHELFFHKTSVKADPNRTKRLQQGAYIVASTLIIDDIS